MDFNNIAITAIVTEATTEAFKNILSQSNANVKPIYVQLFSVLVGVLLAFTLQLDITYAINQQIDFVGLVVTGILISRGSNYLHDLITTITNYTKK
jgi:multidrug transporter EmrE-like cation transporter